MRIRKIILSVCILSTILALSACNLGRGTAGLSPANSLATSVAATLTAWPTASISPSPDSLDTPTLPATPTTTITPTYSVPMLKVNEGTNCRTGPGQEYPVLYTANAGAKLQIVGSYPGYWIVKGSDGVACWMWGEYVSVSGSHWAVPTMTAPPTPTYSPPTAPRGLKYEFECAFGSVTVNLQWTDTSSNEDGFRVLRDGVALISLPANSTSYTDAYSVSRGITITYSVEAFNFAGTAGSSPISFACP
jgi:hypothetical protein